MTIVLPRLIFIIFYRSSIGLSPEWKDGGLQWGHDGGLAFIKWWMDLIGVIIEASLFLHREYLLGTRKSFLPATWTNRLICAKKVGKGRNYQDC